MCRPGFQSGNRIALDIFRFGYRSLSRCQFYADKLLILIINQFLECEALNGNIVSIRYVR